MPAALIRSMSQESAMANGRPGPEPRLLPIGVTEERLRQVVAANRSWRGVMQALGLKSSSFGPKLRNACNALDVDYGHFRSILATDARLREVISTSADWPTALGRLGYAKGSGTARATVRKHCKRLGIDTSHLPSSHPFAPVAAGLDQFTPKREHLRNAGPYLVLFAFNAAGVPATLAPEGVAYDVLADIPAEGLTRVQVKTGTMWDSGGWICRLSRSQYDKNGHGGHRQAVYSSEDIDYFACIDGDFQLFLIPIAVVEGLGSISLRKYEAHRLHGLYDSRLW
jgi:hypothetical protein